MHLGSVHQKRALVHLDLGVIVGHEPPNGIEIESSARATDTHKPTALSLSLSGPTWVF